MYNTFFEECFSAILFVLNLQQRYNKKNLWLSGYKANKLWISRLRNLRPTQMTSCCSYTQNSTFIETKKSAYFCAKKTSNLFHKNKDLLAQFSQGLSFTKMCLVLSKHLELTSRITTTSFMQKILTQTLYDKKLFIININHKIWIEQF